MGRGGKGVGERGVRWVGRGGRGMRRREEGLVHV